MPSASAIKAGAAYVEIFADDSQLVRGLKDAEYRVRAMGNVIGNIGAGLAGIGAAITDPFVAAATKFAETGSALAFMSLRTGISVEALSSLGYAARQTNSSMEMVEGVVRKMQRSITAASEKTVQAELNAQKSHEETGDAAERMSDSSVRAAGAFAYLGLSVRRLLAMSPENQFVAIAERIAEIPDPTTRAGLAMQIWGKSAAEILPLVTNMKALIAESKEFGLVATTKGAFSALELEHAFTLLSETTGRIFGVLGAAAAPMITEWTVAMARSAKTAKDFVTAHKDVLATVFEVGKGLAIAGSSFLALAAAIRVAGSTIGLMRSVLTGLNFAFVTINATVYGFAATMRTLFLSTSVFQTAMSGATIAITALISPAGLLAVGLAGIIVYMYKIGTLGPMIKSLGKSFLSLWEDVDSAFSGIADSLASGDIGGAIKILWETIKLEWLKGELAVSELWDKWGVDIYNKMGGLTKNVRSLWIDSWSGIQSTWVSATSDLTGIWRTFGEQIDLKWQETMDKILKKWEETSAKLRDGVKWLKSFGNDIEEYVSKISITGIGKKIGEQLYDEIASIPSNVKTNINKASEDLNRLVELRKSVGRSIDKTVPNAIQTGAPMVGSALSTAWQHTTIQTLTNALADEFIGRNRAKPEERKSIPNIGWDVLRKLMPIPLLPEWNTKKGAPTAGAIAINLPAEAIRAVTSSVGAISAPVIPTEEQSKKAQEKRASKIEATKEDIAKKTAPIDAEKAKALADIEDKRRKAQEDLAKTTKNAAQNRKESSKESINQIKQEINTTKELLESIKKVAKSKKDALAPLATPVKENPPELQYTPSELKRIATAERHVRLSETPQERRKREKFIGPPSPFLESEPSRLQKAQTNLATVRKEADESAKLRASGYSVNQADQILKSRAKISKLENSLAIASLVGSPVVSPIVSPTLGKPDQNKLMAAERRIASARLENARNEEANIQKRLNIIGPPATKDRSILDRAKKKREEAEQRLAEILPQQVFPQQVLAEETGPRKAAPGEFKAAQISPRLVVPPPPEPRYLKPWEVERRQIEPTLQIPEAPKPKTATVLSEALGQLEQTKLNLAKLKTKADAGATERLEKLRAKTGEVGPAIPNQAQLQAKLESVSEAAGSFSVRGLQGIGVGTSIQKRQVEIQQDMAKSLVSIDRKLGKDAADSGFSA